MAYKIGNGLDLQKTELYNAVLHVLSSSPSSPAEGQVYYDSTDKSPAFYDGTGWIYMDVAKVANGYIPIAKLAVDPLARANHTGTQAWSTLTGTPTTLTGYGITDAVPATRTISTTAPITGGGDLSANRTIGISAATTAAAGSMSSADKSKLDGIASGATANSPDATLLARANHTGTQTASTISDFDTQVRTNRLDQMTAPTAAVDMNGQKLTDLDDGTADSDAATVGQMNEAIQQAASGLDPKDAVNAATTTNITLSGAQTIDGVSITAGQRVLVKDQSSASANGIYIAAAGAWSRADDAVSGTLTSGALVLVLAGTVNAATQWYLTTADPIVVGTTAQSWVQFGAGNTYSAGDGLDLTGSTFSVQPKSGGAITVDSSGVDVDTSKVVRKYAATIGDGSTTAITVTHGLGTKDITVSIREVSGDAHVLCDITSTSTTQATFTFAVAPASNSLRVTVHG